MVEHSAAAFWQLLLSRESSRPYHLRCPLRGHATLTRECARSPEFPSPTIGPCEGAYLSQIGHCLVLAEGPGGRRAPTTKADNADSESSFWIRQIITAPRRESLARARSRDLSLTQAMALEINSTRRCLASASFAVAAMHA